MITQLGRGFRGLSLTPCLPRLIWPPVRPASGPAMYRLPVALSWVVAPQAFVWLSKLMWHSGDLRLLTLAR